MSTLAELFDAIPAQAWQQSRTHPQPADEATDVVTDAAAALAHAARLLEYVGNVPLGRGRYAAERARATTALAAECRATAQAMTTGVESAGRLCQLMAAAADQAAVQRPRPNSDERWAITTAALTPIQACAAILGEHAPSPGLIRLIQQIDRVSEHATALPATPAASARLDQVLPPPKPVNHRALDRAVHAVDALSYAAAATDLTAHDARHVTVAALHIAIYATHIQELLAAAAPALTPAQDARPACDQMVKLWFATRDAVRNAVAGRPPPTNVSVGWAGETVTSLEDAFGPVTAPVIEAAGTPPLVATAYRAMINRLPGLARNIADAAAGWGVPRRESIEADQPIPWRDRGGIQRYSRVQSTQLDPNRCLEAATAAYAAATASTAVVAHADRTSMRLGTQPHRYLAAAYIHAAQTTPTPATIRWAEIVEAIDHRLVAGPDWPALAAALDRAEAAGYNLRINLPRLVAAEPLPDRLPACELRYRLINEEPAAGTLLPRGVALVASAGQDAAVDRTRQATRDRATVASPQPRTGPVPSR